VADTPAWVTLTAVAATGVLSIVGNQVIERYKTKAARVSEELKARRDYEYEARKRLYAETEPVLFQFYESAAYVVNRILNLARASRDGDLTGSDSWWHDPYYLRSTVHGFLAPLAAFHILRHRITLLDLGLDSALERQYELGKAANRSWNRDIEMSHVAPPLQYDPNHKRAREYAALPGGESTYRRQGVFGGLLQRAAAALVVTDGASPQVRTFAEFSAAYDDRKSSVRRDVEPVLEVFKGFVPEAHPVLWRIIIAQLFVYRAVRLYRERDLSDDEVLARVLLTGEEQEAFAFSTNKDDAKRVREAYTIGSDYLRKALAAAKPAVPTAAFGQAASSRPGPSAKGT
jgi:hypothetical protein